MKKIRNQKTETRIFLLIFFVSLILCAACGEESYIQSKKSTTDVEPDQILIKPHIVISEDGITSAIIESHVVEVYEDSNFTSLKDSVVIHFFNKEGEHTTTLTALYGKVWGLYETVDSLKAVGDVMIVSEEQNASLETEEIRWIASTHKVYSDGLVTINSSDGFEQGTGFVANDDLSEYEFTGPVSGEIRGEKIKLFDRR